VADKSTQRPQSCRKSPRGPSRCFLPTTFQERFKTDSSVLCHTLLCWLYASTFSTKLIRRHYREPINCKLNGITTQIYAAISPPPPPNHESISLKIPVMVVSNNICWNTLQNKEYSFNFDCVTVSMKTNCAVDYGRRLADKTDIHRPVMDYHKD